MALWKGMTRKLGHIDEPLDLEDPSGSAAQKRREAMRLIRDRECS
jgi:hypothetical protein